MTSKEGLTWFSAISKRMVLDIYTDVDYAGFVIDKKKKSLDTVCFLGESLVTWRSKYLV